MKAKGLINWCVMLLWFVATHHCLFEQLISKHGKLPVSEAATSDSSSPSECPSHPSGDPSSHSEGKSCGNLLQPSSPNQLNDTTQKTIVPIVNGLLAILSTGLSYSDPFLSSSTASSETAYSVTLLQRALSLSIAPNAPPVTVA